MEIPSGGTIIRHLATEAHRVDHRDCSPTALAILAMGVRAASVTMDACAPTPEKNRAEATRASRKRSLLGTTFAKPPTSQIAQRRSRPPGSTSSSCSRWCGSAISQSNRSKRSAVLETPPAPTDLGVETGKPSRARYESGQDVATQTEVPRDYFGEDVAEVGRWS